MYATQCNNPQGAMKEKGRGENRTGLVGGAGGREGGRGGWVELVGGRAGGAGGWKSIGKNIFQNYFEKYVWNRLVRSKYVWNRLVRSN